ncbi:prepilin peptidase [Ahrensia kielensis]|uniref:Prepilin peptidase n=1 Tax=Ahrensia kielensis TaxID=76980 RepID=A0ABU9T9Q8_9HYPH
MIATIIFVVFPFAMIYAALSDIFSMTIANKVSALLIATFLVVAPFIGLSWHDFGLHLMAFAVVLSVTFAMFALGAMGGGDAKLLASSALWMGFSEHLLNYILMSAMAGGVLAILIILLRKTSMAVYAGELPMLRQVIDAKGIPYGVALAVGGLFAFPDSPAMIFALNYFAN